MVKASRIGAPDIAEVPSSGSITTEKSGNVPSKPPKPQQANPATPSSSSTPTPQAETLLAFQDEPIAPSIEKPNSSFFGDEDLLGMSNSSNAAQTASPKVIILCLS
jgi:hypothetical protein